jgi:branched-chain amino acid transport system permease protein
MAPKIELKNILSNSLRQPRTKWVFYFLVGLAVVGLPFLQFQQNAFWVRVVGYTMLYIILGLGLNLQVGFAGLLDLGYVAFYAIGAYTYALLASGQFGLHLSFWLVLPVAGLLAGIAGVLLGLPVLRMRGDYLAIVTLAFGEIVRILATNLKGLTNGSQGIVGIDSPVLFNLPLKTATHFYYLIFIFLIAALIFVSRLNRSRTGRAWTALREDEDVAQMMGINTTYSKLLSFGIGAMMGGLCGAIFGAWQGSIFPDNFNLMVSINVICLVIIGGMGSIPGVVVGAVALITLPDILRQFSDYRMLLFGLLLVVMMIARPDGFIPARRPALETHTPADNSPKPASASSDEGGEA